MYINNIVVSSILFGIASMYMFTLHAQVGIGTKNPHIGTDLELGSVDKVLLLNRVADLSAIVDPQNGMIVYHTADKCVRSFENNAWSSCWNGEASTAYNTPQIGANFTNGFELNATCSSQLISKNACNTVNGAVINDIIGTDGIEYDWSAGSGLVDGNTSQNLIEIAGQCWYRRNAVNVPEIHDPIPAWTNMLDVGWSGIYTGGPYTDEGRLYQWSAAMNGSASERAQGICPSGWHVPSDCEWMYLEHSLGMVVTEQEKISPTTPRGTNEGSKLKIGGSSGFSALLTGARDSLGNFVSRTNFSYFWTSSTDGGMYFSRGVNDIETGVFRRQDDAAAWSVRCLKN